jgi:uncharacterized protein YvpB
MIFFLTFLNTSNLFPEKFTSWLPGKKEESPYLAQREIALVKKEPIMPESKILDVPLINQMDSPKLTNGCEVTSLAMVLQYYGLKVTKNELANKIETVPLMDKDNKMGNPNIGFVGDMANGPGLCVYNGPIFDLATKYVGNKAVNLTNSPFDDLLKKVGRGIPVWVITTNNYEPTVPFEKWDTQQGTIFITYSEHSVVITGYDQNYIYVNDPYGYKNMKIDKWQFIVSWEEMGKQAIAIEK